jgi:hypothetical protein
LILVGGAWLAQYLGRTLLVWAANENLPAPRRWAAGLRILITFMSVAVAAEVLQFAERVFFAAFLILAGGMVLAVSLALGVGGGESVREFLADRKAKADADEHSIWQHL